MPNYRNKNKGRKNKNHKKNQNNSKKNLQPTTQTDVTVAESQSTEQSERSQLNSERDCPNQLLTPLQHETIATADNETVRDCENPIRPDKLSDNNVICKEEDDIIREVAPIEMGLKSSKPFTPTDPDSSNSYEGKPGEGNSQLGKVIVHRVIQESDGVAEKAGDNLESGQNECKDLTENVKVIIHTVVIEEPNDKEQSYHVELPETAVKEDYYSESEDKEIQIQEVSDGSLSDYNDNPPLVSEVESEPEAVLSPSNSAYTIDTYCEESKSTACYEDLKQRRVQKRVALEAHFLPQLLTPRYLDSISEENSDVSDARSDCSDNSSVRSIVSASTTDCSTADNDPKTKKANSIYPRSNLDFSRRHKHGPYPKTLTLPCAIREESPMVVETKLIVLPEYQSMESCSTLSSVHEQESEEAEVVYINSASSSASDLLELDLEKTAADALKGINLDTDVREIITQPFNTKAESSSRESTPVNQLTAEELNLEMEITTSNKKSGTLCEEQNNAHITNQEDQISSLADVLSCRGESQRFNNDAERNSDSESFTNAQYSDSETLTSSNSNSFCVDQTVKQINLLENFQMDNVREIVNNNFNKLDNEDNIDNQLKDNIKEDCVRSTVVSPSEARVDHFARDSPPPLPPPPHMVDISSAEQPQYENFEFLKSNNNGLTRQESADSHCSNSTTHSQCTAINVGASKHSKIDVDVISSFSENHNDSANCRSVTELSSKCSSYPEQGPNEAALKKLRQLCAEALASMPYGQEVLEELASVAQNIGEVHAVNSASITKKMPYPIPDLPHISDLQLSTGSTPQEEHSVAITQLHSEQTSKLSSTTPSPPPPPVPAPPSRNDAWLGLPSESNPKLLVCLSPFQRTCISENGNPSANNPDLLLDAHQKFLERRGYHEYSIDQVKAMNSEKLEEQQILKTASIMKKLRKSLTPPPIPPPPVPSKSCETAAKAQIQAKATIDRNDTSFSSGCTNEKAALYSDGEENKHRLLAIIHDTDDSKQNLIPKTSSFQNNSRQTAVEQGEPLAPEPEPRHTTQQPTHQENVRTDLHFAKSDQHSPSQPLRSASTGEDIFNKTGDIDISMQTVGGACVGAAGGHTNLYDEGQRRFSNIESYSNTPYSSQILNTQPKRFSNIETHSYESKKRIENGQVVLDFSTSNHESHREGDLPGNSVPQQSLSTDESKIVAEISSNSGKSNGMDVKVHGEFTNKATPTSTEEIMSALNLNTNHLKTTKGSSLVDVEKSEDRTATKLNREINERRNVFINRQQSENNSSNKDINGGSTYDEFRQRAKAAAEAASAAPSTAPISFSGDKLGKSSFHFDHENLFKDFDELSKQLHMELETGKAQRLRRDQEREKSASLYDLSGMQKHFNSQCEEMKKRRHEHMQELEREIERSMRSRQLRNLSKPRDDISRNSNLTAESDSKTFQIPIQIEGDQPASQSATTSYSPQGGRTFEIPVQVADTPQTTLNHQNSEQIDHSRFRRAESMFDVTDNVSQRHRQRSTSINNESHVDADIWSRYATDLGSSQNITRPFAREVEICYQRLRPNAIKAPRLSASTNDLSTRTHGFDAYNNAYHSRRAYAPMLNPVAQKSRPQYLSCTSMIERDPNPTYISTTSRRGASPAPPSLQTTDARSIFEQDRPTIQRRASLPRELHEQQLKYIASKEEELRTEFERLESERQRLLDEMNRTQPVHTPSQRPKKEFYRTAPKLPTLSEDEVFRQQMAEEWLNKIAEREERRLQKIIKISKLNEEGDGHPINVTHTHMGSTNADIGEEFLNRVKERRSKLCMPADSDWESGAESQPQPFSQGQESDIDELPPVKVIDGKSETNINQLPKHLREFAKFSNHQNENINGNTHEVHREEEHRKEASNNSMSTATKKSSIIKTIKISRNPAASDISSNDFNAIKASDQVGQGAIVQKQIVSKRTHTERNNCKAELEQFAQHTGARNTQRHRQAVVTGRPIKVASPSSTATDKCRKRTRFLITPKRRSWSESDLLKEIDNELQLAKGFLFADVYKVKQEYMSEPETEHDHPKKMAQLGPRQYDGIGPTTNDGMPIILRSEVKEPHQHEWYKRLYQTIHKQKNGEDYVIRYKCPRGRQPYKSSGYQSEPEPSYESTVRYSTLDRRRLNPVASTSNIRNNSYYNQDDKIYGSMPNPIKSGQNLYKNQPGRIEDYVTGHSSISEKEKKEWWDEVMDIFNGNWDQTKLSSHYAEGNLSRALAKESGYTSDSNLVFRKKEVTQGSPLSPVEQKVAYKHVQAGGEPPLFGFRKPAPEKAPESPNRYSESDVNIHFKTPVRHEFKTPIPAEELAIRQAEQMQKLYQEERRRKYLQELQDMNSRRHTDNFTPSQKSPIALNRYDDFPLDISPKSPNMPSGPKSVAKALYNFNGQNARELSFKKGDVIYLRRQIDKNWYEGEHNAMIGLLPVNYVEVIGKDTKRQPRKPSEGQARAKYNFQAQSGVELSLNKGELVTLTHRVDDNWFEGKIANRKGIFPVSYVEVLTDIGAEDIAAKTVIVDQSTTNMRPPIDFLRTNINNEFNSITQNGHQPPNSILRDTKLLHKTDILHVDTTTEPLTYRALYKYKPQNSDELELLEGDIVQVLEKCDDGWFVGTSQRTGCFGTFPGNYVERV